MCTDIKGDLTVLAGYRFRDVEGWNQPGKVNVGKFTKD